MDLHLESQEKPWPYMLEHAWSKKSEALVRYEDSPVALYSHAAPHDSSSTKPENDLDHHHKRGLRSHQRNDEVRHDPYW
jgi:hypothetical protein